MKSRILIGAIMTQLLIAGLAYAGPARASTISPAVPAAAEKRSGSGLHLRVGGELFWEGGNIDFAATPDPALCGTTGECFEYPLEVEQGGSRLRVALRSTLQDVQDVRPFPDFPLRAGEGIFRVQLFAPDADPQTNEPLVEGSTGSFFTAYDVEIFLGHPDPAPPGGTYTIRVIPESASDIAFRMRAKLERRPSPGREGLLAPNLRIIPPFEVGFPLTTIGFGPGVPDVPESRSCMAEEVEEAIAEGAAPPQLCLRYSMGFENAGKGRLDLRSNAPGGSPNEACADVTNGATTCLLHQRRWTSEGDEYKDEPAGSAGEAHLHPTHMHFHYQNIYEFQLLEVEEGWKRGDPTPRLTKAGRGRKFGVMPSNEIMADWQRFFQQDRDFHGGGLIELQAGWGDIYEWNRSGNYIDFPQDPPGSGLPKEGFYVLQGETDPLEKIIESTETDNMSYSFIEVSENGDVELIERGYGTDPWDRHKIVLRL